MTTHQNIDTEMFADSVEWCPFIQHATTLLCGTYQLQEDGKTESSEEVPKTPQVRLGYLRMYKLKSSDANPPELELVYRLHMPGILDIKWCRSLVDDQMVFGLVNSFGELQIWTFIDNVKEPQLNHKLKLDEGCLGLSLDWSTKHESESQKVVASDSTGSISVYDINSDAQCLHRWKAHEFEAWISCFNYWDSNILYSGGDDCKLKGWDLRQDTNSPIFTKRFDMGVCSMQCNSYNSTNQNIIATGGYDEYVRLWDVRNWKRELKDIRLDGGVWRIKWDPFNGTHILTATMYNGFHIINTSNPHEDMSIVTEYKVDDHGSLGYGADWCTLPLNNISDKTNIIDTLISTCSFYDHSLHLWSPQIK
ncbi:hypothetical protein SNE40_019002 [Patella caerulea]|uniref:methylated diphthine methylhydrolase n=1 Tax=Patella caerulea TaxID=87958 RepID=A0AAN8P509_PATCE